MSYFQTSKCASNDKPEAGLLPDKDYSGIGIGTAHRSEIVVIELPAKHVNDWKLERPDCKLSDDEIAILITEPVAIATADRFVALTHQPLRQREIHSAKFVPARSLMMNERDCDYQDNGIRAWFVA